MSSTRKINKPINTKYSVDSDGVRVTINEIVNGNVNNYKTFTVTIPKSVIIEAHNKYIKPTCKCTTCPWW